MSSNNLLNNEVEEKSISIVSNVKSTDDGSIEVKHMDNHKNTRSTPKFKILEASETLVDNILGIVADNRYFPKEKTYLKARIRENALDYDGYIRSANEYFITDYSDPYQVRQRLDSISNAGTSLSFVSSSIRHVPSLIPSLDPNHKQIKTIARSISENKKLLNGWKTNVFKRFNECNERKTNVDAILSSENCPIIFAMPEQWSDKRKNETKYGMDFGAAKNNYKMTK